MPKLQRKSAKVFAEQAQAGVGGVGQFGSLAAGDPQYSKDVDVIQALDAYKNGWSDAVVGNKSPAIEDRNALDYLLSYQQAYIMQRGIAEYLSTETYYQGSVVSSGSSIYISLTDNNTGNDLTNTTYWRKFYTPVEIDAFISQLNNALSNKANVNFSNATKPYVTETNVNGTSWRRVWSDGWCEQGGFTSIPGSGGAQVTFSVPMLNTNYAVFGGTVLGDGISAPAGGSRFYVTNRTTTGMSIDWTNGDHIDATWWEVKGYKAN